MNDAPIIGLEKEMPDPRTNARVRFHTLAICQIVYPLASTAATLYSYESREAKAAGKGHVSPIQVKLPGIPVGDAEQWVYQQLLAADTVANVLAGASAVREVS